MTTSGIEKMTIILVIEDDTTIRDMLAFSLEQADYSVLSAKNGEAGLELAIGNNPDLILLDLMLPKMDGFTLCRKIREKDDKVPILMLTALDSEKDILKGFDSGADDYVTKPFSTALLLARITANLRRSGIGEKVDDLGKPLNFGDVAIDRRKHLVLIDERRIDLRPKEFFLLELMASSPGLVFTREELAEKVWGHDFISSSRTIDVHIKRLREKVEKISAFTYIHTVHTLGYRFEVMANE